MLAFRGAAGQDELTAAIAILGTALRPESAAGGGVVYRPRLTFAVYDSVSGRAAEADTTLALGAARPLGPGEYVNTYVELEAPPLGQAAGRVGVRSGTDEEAGQVYGGPVDVPRLGGRGLTISSVALALPKDGGHWHRGAVALDLIPPAAVESGRAFALYYEVYGLAPGAKYRTELSILPVDGRGALARVAGIFRSGKSGIQVSFTGEATPDSAGTVAELRRIQAGLEPGRYRLRVVVTDLATGETATRERRMEVL